MKKGNQKEFSDGLVQAIVNAIIQRIYNKEGRKEGPDDRNGRGVHDSFT